MKKLTFLIFLMSLVCVSNAQPPKGKAKPGTIYGTKTDEINAVSASELPSLLAKKDTITVKIKGQAMDACTSKGCWMTVMINDSMSVFVKMKDYGFFVPQDIKGKTVVLDGTSFIKTTSVAELKHYAEDAKKSQQEIDAISKPKSEIRFMASGILVVK